LQLNHSGRYHCAGWVSNLWSQPWQTSPEVTVRVRRVPISGVSLWAQPPGGQVALGDRLVLSCAVAVGTGPLSFSWHRRGLVTPLGTGPHLDLHVGNKDNGHYQCR
ncbi:FCRL2 protein, partial [Smithornis capensis]|nr:FCRL2 protein [Smithornis capensis]